MKYNGKYSLKKHLLTESDTLDEGVWDWMKEKIKGKGKAKGIDPVSKKEVEITGGKKLETYEELRVMLAVYLHRKQVERAANKATNMGEAVGIALKNILSAVWEEAKDQTFGKMHKTAGQVKDLVNIFINLWNSRTSASDIPKAKSNPVMDAFLMDPAYSEMLDPEIENQMMHDWMEWLTKEGLTGPIQNEYDSLTNYAEMWVEENIGDGEERIDGAEPKHGLKDIIIPKLDQSIWKEAAKFLMKSGVETF